MSIILCALIFFKVKFPFFLGNTCFRGIFECFVSFLCNIVFWSELFLVSQVALPEAVLQIPLFSIDYT